MRGLFVVEIAFYRGGGGIYDRLIRWRTSSQFSHCEMVVDGLCFSASPRDGGVREKYIDTHNGKWVKVQLPTVDPEAVWFMYGQTRGAKYDWIGAIIGRGFGAKAHSGDRWFCSEWCAEAIGFSDSWRFSPADLFAVLRGRYA